MLIGPNPRTFPRERPSSRRAFLRRSPNGPPGPNGPCGLNTPCGPNGPAEPKITSGGGTGAPGGSGQSCRGLPRRPRRP